MKFLRLVVHTICVTLASADFLEPLGKVENGAFLRRLNYMTTNVNGNSGSSGSGGQSDISSLSKSSSSSFGAEGANGPTLGLFGVAGGEFIVYIVFAALTVVVGVYYKAHVVDLIIRENKGPLMEFHQHDPHANEFDVGLCDCLSDPCMVFRLICPCTAVIRQAHTVSVVSKDARGRGVIMSFWMALLLYLVGGLCCFVPPLCLTVYLRMKLKERMGLGDNLLYDFCLSWFCSPCTFGQMAEVVDRELGYEMTFCCDLRWDDEATEEYTTNMY